MKINNPSKVLSIINDFKIKIIKINIIGVFTISNNPIFIGMSFDLKKFLIENQLTTNSRIGEVKVNKPGGGNVDEDFSHILLDAEGFGASLEDNWDGPVPASEVYSSALEAAKDSEEDFEYEVTEQEFIKYFGGKVGLELEGEEDKKYIIGGTSKNPTIELVA